MTEKLPKIWVGNEEMEVADTVNAQINLLSMKTPAKYIKQRKGRGGNVYDYVEMNYVVGRLNATFLFNWDCEVVDHHIFKDENQVATKVRLSVRFADGKEVKKEAWGGSDIARYKSGDYQGKIINIADDLKSAEADALKKAASMVGVCWDVYAGLTKSGKQKEEQRPEPGIDDYPESDKDEEFRTIPITIEGKNIMHTKFEALDRFAGAKKQLGTQLYYKVLGEHGFEKSNQIPNKDIPKVYYALADKWKEVGRG